MVATGVYLWVIMSQKLLIATPTILVGLAALLFQRQPLRFPAPLLWYAGFVAWSYLAAPMTPQPTDTLKGAWDYTKLGLIFLLVTNLAQSRLQVRAFMILWLGIFALYPVRGTLFNILFGYDVAGRYAWNFMFRNPNDLATLTLPMFAMAVALVPNTSGWYRTAAVAGTALLPGIIFATQSRGGIVALAVSALILLWEARRTQPRSAPSRETRRRQRKRRRAVLAITVLAGIGVAAIAPRGVWDRLEGLKGVTDTENLRQVDSSAEQRFEIWKVSWAIIRDHPLFGVGAMRYEPVHATYASRSTFNPIAMGARDTHSTYFNLLAESGVPGFLIFMGMLHSLIRLVGRNIATGDEASHLLRSLRAGLIGFLAASVFATMQQVAFLYLYAGLLCLVGLVYGPGVRSGPRPASLR